MVSLFIGPTKSGKTRELGRLVENQILSSIYSKTDSKVFIRLDDLDRLHIDKNCLKEVIINSSLKLTLNNNKEFNSIFIDDAQNVEDLKDYIIKYKCENKNVYIFADIIDSNFETNKNISNILPLVDSIVNLKGICESCGSPLGTLTFNEINPVKKLKKESLEKKCLCLFCYCKKVNYNSKNLENIEKNVNKFYNKFSKANN